MSVDEGRDTLTLDTDGLLDALELEWQVGLNTVARWNECSDYEQLVFALEWAIPRGYYQELEERAGAGRLSPEQRRRFEALRQWIEQHRPGVEAVLGSSSV